MSKSELSIEVALYLKGDELEPSVVTEMLGVEPTKSHAKGKSWLTSSGKEVVEKTGLWKFSLRTVGDGYSEIIQGVCNVAVRGVVPCSIIPGVTNAFIDIFVGENSDEFGGGTFELFADTSIIRLLAETGLPIHTTFVVVPTSPV
ncbi:DUF4279 domain-containing protein [Xanthomonas sp. WHRI 10064A]|uniref:DUF4279 domain-containing protein n=1 Tax=unclassified Xanthomonas TaxID=2643310 RepID=UPI002B22D7A6|nr:MULTISPECIES: DUF4279 domain-containing protein [unclassified Xanthomonas]MEA9590103.1 DUF4279 domain-containing protein [Xanthomonas sp. WHRI 10064B]MEA9617588.1 DUF4279 domain-containing protein [Xanthomonas sp. WHRI 10064A]